MLRITMYTQVREEESSPLVYVVLLQRCLARCPWRMKTL